MVNFSLDTALFEHECGEATVAELIFCITITFLVLLLTFIFTFVMAHTSTSDISEIYETRTSL